MSAKILTFHRDQASGESHTNAGGKLIELKPQKATCPQRPERKARLGPSQEILEAINERDNFTHFNRLMLQAMTWGMVGGWQEVFALGRRNCARLSFEDDRTVENPEMLEDDSIVQHVARTRDEEYAEYIADELYFWDRCAQVYAEEMQEAERLAAEARERIAQKIAGEFPKCSFGIPEAIRENKPQAWAMDSSNLDWQALQ